MKVTLCSSVTPEIQALWNESISEISDSRGGPEFLLQISNGEELSSLLSMSVSNKELWIHESSNAVALCREGVILGIYVRPNDRRMGIARSIINDLISACGAVDGYALPGDRATKSLYESIGWKARLLTMRGE